MPALTNYVGVIGASPIFTVDFTDPDGEPTDPTTVVWKWKVPAGTETTYTYDTDDEVERVSEGVFTFTPPVLTAAGRHSVRVKGTGAVTAAAEGSIAVDDSRFTTP